MQGLGKGLGLSEAEVQTSIEAAGSNPALALERSRERSERGTLLEQLASVVRADGQVVEQEQAFFARVAGALGFAEEEWRPLLEASAPELDSAAREAPAPPVGILISEDAPSVQAAPQAEVSPVVAPAQAAPTQAAAPAGLKARVLAGLPPTSVLLTGVGVLLLLAGVLSFAAPEFLPSQRRILVLLGSVLLAGGAMRGPGRVRFGLWLLMGLTCLTWVGRHPLGAWWFGGSSFALGVAAVVLALAHGGWRPERAHARAGLQVLRAMAVLGLLVVLAGGLAATFEFFHWFDYGFNLEWPVDHGQGRAAGGKFVEQVGVVVSFVVWLIAELVLVVLALASIAAAAALLGGLGGMSLAVDELDEQAQRADECEDEDEDDLDS